MSATEWTPAISYRFSCAEALLNGRASVSLRRCELNPAFRIAGHAIVAGAFFYCLQRFLLGQTNETSVIWALAGGAAAALLAWIQYRRG